MKKQQEKIDVNFQTTLRSFTEKAKKLSESSVIRSYPKLSVKIFDLNTEFPKSEYKFPTEEELESFFARFRHFILKRNNRLNFDTITIKLIDLEEEQQWKDHLTKSLKYFSLYGKVSPVYIRKNEKNILPEELIDTYFNGSHFHSDEEKEGKYESLRAIEPKMVDMIVLMSLLQMTKAIVSVASYINWRYFGKGVKRVINKI